jgi:competence protein ComEA
MTDWIERNRGYILVVVINLAVVGAALFWMQRPDSPQLHITTPTSVASATTTQASPPLLRVDVTGAVAKPDVYRLPPGSIVKDAVQAAGGATADADLTRINLAAELADQQQVRVPRSGEAGTASSSTGGDPPSAPTSITNRVNINRASADELATLPAIGPALARRIVDWRTTYGDFKHIEDIKLVRGIGDSIFEQIRDYITVSD